jgi:histidine triad (HIT) family protein
MDCLFCKISQSQIPANILYQDEQVVIFADINPQAPHHYIIIPRRHISTLNDLQAPDLPLLGHMIQASQQLAKHLQVAENGYRLVMNCNADGGQTVYHIHIHLLSGRQMTWPPG